MITNILREQLREQVTEQVREQVTKQTEATGKLKEGQPMLLLMLPKRLGPMPPEIESAIRSLTDLDRIHFIMAQLMEIRGWQEVKQLLQN